LTGRPLSALVAATALVAVVRFTLLDDFLAYTSDMGSYLMTQNWVTGDDPTGHKLFHWRPPLIGILLVPFTAAFGDLPGSKLLAILSSAAVVPAGYWLARELGIRHWIALIAALVMGMGPTFGQETAGGYLVVLAAAFVLAIMAAGIRITESRPGAAFAFVVLSWVLAGLNQTAVPLTVFAVAAMTVPRLGSMGQQARREWAAAVTVACVACVVWIPFYAVHGGLFLIPDAPLLFATPRFEISFLVAAVAVAAAFAYTRAPDGQRLVWPLVGLWFMSSLSSSEIVLNNVLHRAEILIWPLAIAQVFAAHDSRWNDLGREYRVLIAASFLLMAASGWAVWQARFSTVGNALDMVTPDNLAAVEWIGENTPADAHVYAHPMGLGYYVGALSPRMWTGSWGGLPPAALQGPYHAALCDFGWERCAPGQLVRLGITHVLIDKSSFQTHGDMHGYGWGALDDSDSLRLLRAFSSDVRLYQTR